MKLSIVTVRFNRPEYNEAELASLASQSFPKEDFEFLVVDESTDRRTPEIFKKYSDILNIRYWRFSGWRKPDSVFVMPSGKISHSMYLNFLLDRARGKVILLEAGEFVHMRNSLEMLCDPHERHPGLVVHATIRNVDRRFLDSYDINTCWTSWFAHPEYTPLYDEMACSSVRRSNLTRICGFDESFMGGLQCEVGEIYRRLVRCGMETIFTSELYVGHIEHPPTDRTEDPGTYRAFQRNRRLLDSGFHDYSPKVKYCRPGTNLLPVVTDRNTHGRFFDHGA